MFLKISVLATAVLGAGLSSSWAIEDPRYLPVLESQGDAFAADRFGTLLSIDFDAYLGENPTYATSSGYAGFAGRWGDESAEGIERRRARRLARLTAIKSIDRAALDEAD